MGITERIGRPWKAALLLAVGAGGGGAALAVASVPDGNGVIHACVSVTVNPLNGVTLPAAGPNLRVIDAPSQTCTTSGPAGGPPPETALSWNVTGPTGAPGAPGAPAPPDVDGGSTTVTSGNLLTLPGGNVITIAGSPGLTIAPLPIGNGFKIGRASLGTGDGSLSFDILAFSVASSATPRAAGDRAGAGKAKFNEFQITKHVDSASPHLFQACASGRHFPTVTLQMRKAGGEQLIYKLTDVLISSYQSGGHGNGDTVPLESISLNFTKFTLSVQKHG